MMDYVVVRAFHRPAAYGVACLTELVIAHPRLIGLEIAGGLTYLWWIPLLVQVQAFQHRHHIRHLTIPEQIQLSFYPRFSLGSPLAKDRVCHLPQALTGMIPVYDLDRLAGGSWYR